MYEPSPPSLGPDSAPLVARKKRDARGRLLTLLGLGLMAIGIVGVTLPAASSSLAVALAVLASALAGIILLFVGLGLTVWARVSQTRNRLSALKQEAARHPPTELPVPAPAGADLQVDIRPETMAGGSTTAVGLLVLAGLGFLGGAAGVGWLMTHRWDTGVVEGTLAGAALGACFLVLADQFMAPQRLLSARRGGVINWGSAGVMGPFFPFETYVSGPAGFRLPSPLLRTSVGLLHRPNQVPWRLLNVLVFRLPSQPGEDYALVGLSASARPWWYRGESIRPNFLPPAAAVWTHPFGFPVPLPGGSVPWALQMAFDGGATVAIERGALSVQGKAAADALLGGKFDSIMTRPISGPRWMVMPKSRSLAEVSGWLPPPPGGGGAPSLGSLGGPPVR